MASGTKLGDVVKNAPNALIWAVTVVFVAVLASFVILSVTGSNSDDLRSIINTIMNVAAVVLTGGGAVLAGSAARSAKNTEEQTNGSLDKRIADGVAAGLAVHAAKAVDPVE